MNSTATPSPESNSVEAKDLIDRFGAVYEHSPWVVETVRNEHGTAPFLDLASLKSSMRQAVDQASDDAKLLLIRQHPDLADPAAKAGKLSDMSNREQKSAGLTEASDQEAKKFDELNTAYKAKFGFPFVIAVKGLTRHDILAAFEARLGNSRENELHTALEQIHRIASFRLADIFASDDTEPTP